MALARKVGDRKNEAVSLHALFSISFAQGDLTRAQTQLEQAIDIEQGLGVGALSLHLLLSRAELALAQGRPTDAFKEVTSILPRVQDEPGQIENLLSCYKVLQAVEDPQAIEVLKSALDQLMERAAKISDEETRRSFLQGVADHKEIIREWERLQEVQKPT